jgi:rod shape-determining protein MreB
MGMPTFRLRLRPAIEFFSPGYGIDLGTANTVVASPARGVLLNEPSVMVVRSDGEHMRGVVAVGRDARELIGRTPVGMQALRPLRDGVIIDLQTARQYVAATLRKLKRHPWQIIPPSAVIGVPYGATNLEKRALAEAVEEAGIRNVELVPEPIAGSLGCGVDPMTPRAAMVVDIGGGTSEVTAFCFGGILAARSTRVAGDELTSALLHYLRQQHKIIVGELTAENVKIRLGADGSRDLTIEGRDLSSERPSQVTVTGAELEEALRPTISSIVDALSGCVQDLPPQAVADIMQDGVLVFGGGSMLAGLERRLQETFGLKVRRAENPLTCVAEGAALCLVRKNVVKAYGA